MAKAKAAADDYKAPGTYEVDEDVHLETADRFGERYLIDIKAGKHIPKSEREEHAFEFLVAQGQATAPDVEPAKRPLAEFAGTRWKSPVEVEPEAAEEAEAAAEALPEPEGEES